MIAGIVIIACPENNNKAVVRLSETHGPSILDLIGIVVLMFGYLPLAYLMITRFNVAVRKVGLSASLALIVLILISFLMIGFYLRNDNNLMLTISILISTAAQTLLFLVVLRIEKF